MRLLFKYLWYVTRFPAARDFISEGLGIEARAARTASFWQAHVSNCQNFILQALPRERCSIMIVGAGTLLDIPFKQLLERATTISLIDANPAALPTLRKAQKLARQHGVEVVIDIADVTGRFASWSQYLKLHRAECLAHRQDRSYAQTFSNLARELPALAPHDIVISANILSQLGVLWRDRAATLLRRDETSLNPFLEVTSAILEEEHLQKLGALAIQKLLVLSDIEWMFYAENISEFQVERALEISIPSSIDALTQTRAEQWWWHVAPRHIEQQEFGAIHNIRACEFSR